MNKAVKIFHTLIVILSIVYTTYILSEFVGNRIPYVLAVLLGIMLSIGTHIVSMLAVREYVKNKEFQTSSFVAIFFVTMIGMADFFGSHTKAITEYKSEVKSKSQIMIDNLNSEITSIKNDENFKTRKWVGANNGGYKMILNKAGEKLILAKQNEITSLLSSQKEELSNAENSQIAVVYALRFIALTLFIFVLFTDYYTLINEGNYNNSKVLNSLEKTSKNADFEGVENSRHIKVAGFVQNEEKKNRLDILYEAVNSGERRINVLAKISKLNAKQIKTLLDDEYI